MLKFDEKTNTFTVDKDTQAGELVIKASSKVKPQNAQEKTINITKRAADKIEICRRHPIRYLFRIMQKKTFTYSAKLYDQINKEMVGRKTNWSVEPKEIESMEGVSINETTGELTVDSKAVLGVISIKATDSQNTEISVPKRR